MVQAYEGVQARKPLWKQLAPIVVSRTPSRLYNRKGGKNYE